MPLWQAVSLSHHLRYVGPQPFDFLASVKLVVMAVIGGLASIWGAIFGAGTTRILSDEVLLRFGDWDVVVYGLNTGVGDDFHARWFVC